jgi:hypothetical protein
MITPPMNERAPDLNGDEGFMEIMIAKLWKMSKNDGRMGKGIDRIDVKKLRVSHSWNLCNWLCWTCASGSQKNLSCFIMVR